MKNAGKTPIHETDDIALPLGKPAKHVNTRYPDWYKISTDHHTQYENVVRTMHDQSDQFFPGHAYDFRLDVEGHPDWSKKEGEKPCQWTYEYHVPGDTSHR